MLVEFIHQELEGRRDTLIAAALVSGISNAGIIAIVNAAGSSGQSSARLFFLFLLAIVFYLVGARFTFQQMAQCFEGALQRTKVRVADKVRRAELQSLDRLGASEIYDRITENTTIISESSDALATLMQSSIMVVCVALYLITISPPAFMLSALIIGAGLWIYQLKNSQIRGHLQQTAQTRVAFIDTLTHLIQGFKEIKFSRRRGEELQADLTAITRSQQSSTVNARHLLNDNTLFAQCTFFVLLGVLVFILPRFTSLPSKDSGSLVASIIFVMGPLSGVIMGVPAMTRANMAIENIQLLEQKLEASEAKEGEAGIHDPWRGQLGPIQAREVSFHYPEQPNQESFNVGPVTLTVQPGELLFLVGGNGSGKSTLLKVLTGLYPPSEGELSMSGLLVEPDNLQSYRELISTIYSDFHLFPKLYGLAHVDTAEVHRLLRLLRLDTKTNFSGGRFTQLNLSTGQRKRLALVVSLLENRPLLAFDEWAADQDPEFRQYFYTELLPLLKSQGKTLLVVTHDDRYFHVADRVVTMEYGRIRSIDPRPGPSE